MGFDSDATALVNLRLKALGLRFKGRLQRVEFRFYLLVSRRISAAFVRDEVMRSPAVGINMGRSMDLEPLMLN